MRKQKNNGVSLWQNPTIIAAIIGGIFLILSVIIQTPNAIGINQPVIIVLFQTITGNTPGTPPVVITPILTPIATSISTREPVSTLRAIVVCPDRQITGANQEVQLSINVSAGYIQYLAGSRFDEISDGVLVTVNGPYTGQHKLYNGMLCAPVLKNSPEDQAAKEQVLRELAFGNAKCPEDCPIEVNLP